ncbi:MAG: family 16 glycosylhydrolase [bacterium]
MHNTRTATRICFIFISFASLNLLGQSKPYSGAEYRTKASHTYGRFEVRIKSASGSGMLTSFFTFHDPVPFSTANWNEIDIEAMGRYSNETQFNTITPGRIDHVRRQPIKFNPHIAFHIFAFEWTPDYIAWFVDGYEVHRQTASHVNTLSREQKVMMNIWQPTAVAWAGLFNPASLPLHGFYDWVKYYAYTPGVGDNFTLQWTDNFDNWDQNRWSKATHTFDGNDAVFIPDNVVFRNGYMILCLTMPNATGYRGGVIVDLDVDAPYLVWARAEDNTFKVFFSEEVERASAETVTNYTVPGVTIQSATLLPGNKIVALKTDTLDLTKSYVLVATGIKDRSNSAHQMGVQHADVANGLRFPIKINVAGGAEANFLPDKTWDFYQEYGAVGGSIKRRPPGTIISGTNEEAIYQTEREALTFYQVRVPPGRYDVTLMMADTKFDNPGQRVFEVYAEGQRVVDNLDIVATVGKNVALEKVLSSFDVSDGVLDLYFKPQIDFPTLSGVKITRLVSTGVKFNQAVPEKFAFAIYPNPFNPSTKIVYTLEKSGRVKLVLFDTLGRLVGNLAETLQPAGTHTYLLETNQLSAGVYFVNMLFDGQIVATTKLLFLK